MEKQVYFNKLSKTGLITKNLHKKKIFSLDTGSKNLHKNLTIYISMYLKYANTHLKK